MKEGCLWSYIQRKPKSEWRKNSVTLKKCQTSSRFVIFLPQNSKHAQWVKKTLTTFCSIIDQGAMFRLRFPWSSRRHMTLDALCWVNAWWSRQQQRERFKLVFRQTQWSRSKHSPKSKPSTPSRAVNSATFTLLRTSAALNVSDSKHVSLSDSPQFFC